MKDSPLFTNEGRDRVMALDGKVMVKDKEDKLMKASEEAKKRWRGVAKRVALEDRKSPGVTKNKLECFKGQS